MTATRRSAALRGRRYGQRQCAHDRPGPRRRLLGGHHRGRQAIAVIPVLEWRGTTSVTTEIPSGSADGRHRARPDVLDIGYFNDLDGAAAAEVLQACLDVPEWVAAVAAGRPYRSAAELYDAGAAAAAVLSWPQVSGALDRHPRIGQQRAAAPGSATETAWSSAEQAGVADRHAQALAAGNEEYERRFGHLFLVCASGLTGEEILEALHARLHHEPAVERDVVTGELRKIAALRLAKAVTA